MTQQILEPASEAEAAMAGAARACLVAALDHSKAEKIRVTIEIDGEGERPVLNLPPTCAPLLCRRASSDGEAGADALGSSEA